MENIVIAAQKRTDSGTKEATLLRRAGRIPAVIYGDKEPVSVSVTLQDVRHAIYTPDFRRVSVDLDGSQLECILKDVQYHPVTDAVIHIDFMRLVEGQQVKVEVPIRFDGVSVGIKAGGKLIQKMRRVKIKTSSENLVDEVFVDVTNLNLGQSVRVRDIQLPENVEILNSPGIPIATVGIPRALKGPDDVKTAAAPGATAAVPEAAKKAAEPAKKAEAPKK